MSSSVILEKLSEYISEHEKEFKIISQKKKYRYRNVK